MPSEADAVAALAFGDIVLVSFPFTSQTEAKRRPAAVISSDAYDRALPDVIVMAVTSQLRPAPAFGEVWLENWHAAGLLKPSAIKPVIATLERGLVIRRLGALGDEDRAALRRLITDLLG